MNSKYTYYPVRLTSLKIYNLFKIKSRYSVIQVWTVSVCTLLYCNILRNILSSEELLQAKCSYRCLFLMKPFVLFYASAKTFSWSFILLFGTLLYKPKEGCYCMQIHTCMYIVHIML